jgi:hypothetical protein
VAENSSTKTRQAKKKEKTAAVSGNGLCISIRFRRLIENGFFLVRMRESSLSAGLDAHHPMWWWWLVPLSSAQGWLDAYFVNIRTCEVKRNIQKGTNKPKRKKNNLWT